MNVDHAKLGEVVQDAFLRWGSLADLGRAAEAAYLAQICGPDCGTCRLYAFRCEWAQPLPDVAPVHASQFLPGPNCPAKKKEG